MTTAASSFQRRIRALTIGLGAAVVLFGLATDVLVCGAPGIGRMQLTMILLGTGIAFLSALPWKWHSRLLLQSGSLAGTLLLGEALLQWRFAGRFNVLRRPSERCIYEYIPLARQKQG